MGNGFLNRRSCVRITPGTPNSSNEDNVIASDGYAHEARTPHRATVDVGTKSGTGDSRPVPERPAARIIRGLAEITEAMKRVEAARCPWNPFPPESAWGRQIDFYYQIEQAGGRVHAPSLPPSFTGERG